MWAQIFNSLLAVLFPARFPPNAVAPGGLWWRSHSQRQLVFAHLSPSSRSSAPLVISSPGHLLATAGEPDWLAGADQIIEITHASRKASETSLHLSGDSVDPRVLVLRPMSDLRPSSRGRGPDLVYVVDEDWDLWLLDAAAALETPDDYWLD